MELMKLIKFSPKHTTFFEQIKANLSPQTNSLKPFVQQGGQCMLLLSMQCSISIKY